MKLEEWSAQVRAEFVEAGFVVSDHEGFPLVKSPETFGEKMRLLKFRPRTPVSKSIYKEGVLLTPAGM